jgi:4-amino-4-deoxy-L-arabinose transferase-like glycosyltransferase
LVNPPLSEHLVKIRSNPRLLQLDLREIGVWCVLFLAVLVLFLTAPKQDDFWWTDAPAHAMNGALLHDYLWTTPHSSPLRFAFHYYLHYPALTISVYPPLFPMAEMLVYSVFGVSHFAAQLTVSFFALLLAYFLYRMARTALGPIAACGAALLLLSTPMVALWSRQVMLEIPALALLVAASALFLRFLEDRTARLLYLSVLLLCGAIYTKQTTAFAIVPFAATLLLERGWQALRQPSTWIAAAIGFLVLLPIAAFTAVYASHNLEIAAGIGPEAGSHLALSSFLFYGCWLPEIAGPTSIATALGYLVLITVHGWRSVQERRLAVFMIGWFVADYLFISSIAHREDRYGIFLTVPVAILAILLVMRFVPRTIASGIAFVIGTLLFGLAMVSEPVPRVPGYDAIAAFILKHAEKDSIVLFHGFRSPNFVFAVRAQSSSPELYLLRSEKMLVDYKVSRDWGITDRGLSRKEVEKLIDRYGIEYVVLQPDFWTDLPSMAALQGLVYSDRFTKVAEFRVSANVSTREKELLVFKNNRPTHPLHPAIELKMPMINGSISGVY